MSLCPYWYFYIRCSNSLIFLILVTFYSVFQLCFAMVCFILYLFWRFCMENMDYNYSMWFTSHTIMYKYILKPAVFWRYTCVYRTASIYNWSLATEHVKYVNWTNIKTLGLKTCAVCMVSFTHITWYICIIKSFLNAKLCFSGPPA